MKLKSYHLLLFISSAFSMEAPEAFTESNCTTSALPLVRGVRLHQASKSIETIDYSFTQDSQRFITLDPKLPIPILQQYRSQAVELYQARQLYYRDQMEFLKYLRQQASNLQDKNLQTLHPWFSTMSDHEIIAKLEKNTKNYSQSIKSLNNIIEDLTDSTETVETIFRFLVAIRSDTLDSRLERRIEKGVKLPSTRPEDFNTLELYSKFVCLEAVTNFRILDEQIYALFPYISQSFFESIDSSPDTPNLIKQDFALMKFLSGEVAVPHDPDTTEELLFKPQNMLSLLNALTGVKKPSRIPSYYIRLYNNLRAQLASKLKHPDPSYLADILKHQPRNKPSNRQKNKKKLTSSRKRIITSDQAQLVKIEAEKLSQTTIESSSILVQKRIKKTPDKPVKVMPPLGGWSLHDQQRSIEAKERLACQFIAVPSADVQQTQFRPASPIILSSNHYQTLQEILSEETPPYTLTFNQVCDLFEAVGIKVDRNGGSHAHIHTPGHNLKTLVDIHYGWTDKYGPKTMKGLRTLMQNLGLDNPENVIEG